MLLVSLLERPQRALTVLHQRLLDSLPDIPPRNVLTELFNPGDVGGSPARPAADALLDGPLNEAGHDRVPLGLLLEILCGKLCVVQGRGLVVDIPTPGGAESIFNPG